MKTLTGLFGELWGDECGAILSAEAALLGTVGVLGAGAGLSAVAESVDAEMKDVAFAIRSLDQSYSFNGMGDRCRCSKAWTAGSSFTQQPIEEAHAELQHLIDDLESHPDAEAAHDAKGGNQSEPTVAPAAKPTEKRKPPQDAARDKSRQDEAKKREAQKKKEMEARKKRQKEMQKKRREQEKHRDDRDKQRRDQDAA